MNFKSLTENQSRIYIDTVQLYESFLDFRRKSLHYKGGMFWKKSKGKEYLFRLSDRNGNGKSLGARSEETEKILENFLKNKNDLQIKNKNLNEQIKEQAKFCKAAGINRVPSVITAILRLLEAEGLLGKSLTVVGTNALFAYEMAAGVFFDSGLTATADMDLMWDTRCRLTLYAENKIASEGLIKILKKADNSFDLVLKGGFSAVNKKGYMVDLIKPIPKPVGKKVRRSLGKQDDLEAADINKLEWLISSPKFYQTVIGIDGFPAKMVVPDPRVFALHKIWVSKQVDREPVKKKRDLKQALITASLIVKYLPQFKFKKDELKMFPQKIVNEMIREIEKETLPVGFE